MTEMWLALVAGFLLAAAGVARGLTLLRGPGWWGLITTIARLAAAALLLGAAVSAAIGHGEWSPLNLRQVALDLSFVVLGIHLVLAWRQGVDGAGPVVDVVLLLLLLVGVFVVPSGASPLACAQRTVAAYASWVLLLLGGGGVLVAASSGGLVVLRALQDGRGWELGLPSDVELQAFLRQATGLALIGLGSGLTISVWWAWHTAGSLAGGHLRPIWMAGVWLVVGLSWLSWQLERRAGRWAVVWAIAAAALMLVGLLAVLDPQHLLEI